METSAEMNEFAKAMVEVQREMKDAYKDKQGYGYNYADLAQVLQIVRPLLAKHGIALLQPCEDSDDKVVVTTKLLHISGQWVKSSMKMTVERSKNMSLSQSVGSTQSYARRYSLAAMVGLAQSDNDGAVEAVDPVKSSSTFSTISHAQSEHLRSLIGNDEVRLGRILGWAKISKLSDMPLDTYAKAIELVNKSHAKVESDINGLLSDGSDQLLDSVSKSDKVAKKLSAA